MVCYDLSYSDVFFSEADQEQLISALMGVRAAEQLFDDFNVSL